MTYNFCTFFDKHYIGRGLALYYSLIEHCEDFTLWILCTDAECYSMLERMHLDKVRLLKIQDVEDDRMKVVKPSRTHIEYTWMFSSQLPLYLLSKYPEIETIAYMDADLFFYSSLEPMYEEFGTDSILIIPHRYSLKNRFREKTSGIYNVGLLIFRNDERAKKCLNWWKERCLEWCYARYENGKHGDQMYLDDWPTRFDGVHVLQHEGGDVAPWNIANYSFRMRYGKIIGTNIQTKELFPLIFFHFHGLKIYLNNNKEIVAYPITIHNRSIYKKYIDGLNRAYGTVQTFVSGWDLGCAEKIGPMKYLKQYITMLITR